jgi:hypothetical protein
VCKQPQCTILLNLGMSKLWSVTDCGDIAIDIMIDVGCGCAFLAVLLCDCPVDRGHAFVMWRRRWFVKAD